MIIDSSLACFNEGNLELHDVRYDTKSWMQLIITRLHETGILKMLADYRLQLLPADHITKQQDTVSCCVLAVTNLYMCGNLNYYCTLPFLRIAKEMYDYKTDRFREYLVKKVYDGLGRGA